MSVEDLKAELEKARQEIEKLDAERLMAEMCLHDVLAAIMSVD